MVFGVYRGKEETIGQHLDAEPVRDRTEISEAEQ